MISEKHLWATYNIPTLETQLFQLVKTVFTRGHRYLMWRYTIDDGHEQIIPMIMWEMYRQKTSAFVNCHWLNRQITEKPRSTFLAEVVRRSYIIHIHHRCTIFFLHGIPTDLSSRQTKITNAYYSIGKENHHFRVASVVCTVPNEWTRRRTRKNRKLCYHCWLTPPQTPGEYSQVMQLFLTPILTNIQQIHSCFLLSLLVM